MGCFDRRIPPRLFPPVSVGSVIRLGSCLAGRTLRHENSVIFKKLLKKDFVTLKIKYCRQCYRPVDQRNAECPVCQEPLNKLAERLPHAHCSQSRLICRLSGLPLNEHNLPMMLPNGRVYGEQVTSLNFLD